MIYFCLLVGIPNTVNTLTATTSRKRPLAEFLDDCDHFLNHKLDIFLCVSAPSERPPGMITNDYKKTIARTS